ncbi:MAG: FtsW/RodA/SpoVE family cell cycle protein [Bacteroides sp.]
MQKKRLKKVKYFDYSLLFVIIFLLGFGLVMIYSTSSYNAQIKFNDSEYFFKKQLFAEILGIVCMYAAYKIDYHIWVKYAAFLYVVAMVMIVLVLSPLGYSAYGARRWISIGPLSIQPAEFAKLALIFSCTAAVNKMNQNSRKFAAIFVHLFLGAVLAGMIFVITNNLSSAIIIFGIAVVISFVAYPKYNIYVIVAGLVGALVVAVRSWAQQAQLSDDANFRFERILAWVNPEKFADDTGFQTVQALYAIGSGGLFGKGLGKSLQKLGFIPEAQNDMIFSVICEELGLFGALCVLIVFGLMLWRFVYIATNAPDLTGCLLVVGVFAHIAIQVVLNVAVVTNLIPNTGISLPFISYGGTSVLFLMAEMGIVLNVSSHIRMEI